MGPRTTFDDNVPNAEDGCLVITTKDEFYIDRNYTSGRINTAGKASWGPNHRIVARVFPLSSKKAKGFDERDQGWDYIIPKGRSGHHGICGRRAPQPGKLALRLVLGEQPNGNPGTTATKGRTTVTSIKKCRSPSRATEGIPRHPATLMRAVQNRYGVDWFDDRIEFFVGQPRLPHSLLRRRWRLCRRRPGPIHHRDRRGGQPPGPLSEYAHHFPEWYPYEHKMYVILSAGVGGSDIYTTAGPSPGCRLSLLRFVDWVNSWTPRPPPWNAPSPSR